MTTLVKRSTATVARQFKNILAQGKCLHFVFLVRHFPGCTFLRVLRVTVVFPLYSVIIVNSSHTFKTYVCERLFFNCKFIIDLEHSFVNMILEKVRTDFRNMCLHFKCVYVIIIIT